MTDVLPAPIDIRFMNALTSALMLFLVAVVVVAGLAFLFRLPQFTFGGIVVTGSVTHTNAITLRANVAPRLDGNFFTIELSRVRELFERQPWIRKAVVRRDFPNLLRVQVQEHAPAAYWGDDEDLALLNDHGEIFEANLDELERDDLPRLNGPRAMSGEILGMYRALQPEVGLLDLGIESLELSARGGWKMVLDNGAAMELGAGSIADVLSRTQRFVRTVNQVTSRQGRRPTHLQSVDLRHKDGYAVRLAGVTTSTPDDNKRGQAAARVQAPAKNNRHNR